MNPLNPNTGFNPQPMGPQTTYEVEPITYEIDPKEMLAFGEQLNRANMTMVKCMEQARHYPDATLLYSKYTFAKGMYANTPSPINAMELHNLEQEIKDMKSSTTNQNTYLAFAALIEATNARDRCRAEYDIVAKNQHNYCKLIIAAIAREELEEKFGW